MGTRRWMLLHGTPLGPAVWHPTAAYLDDRSAVIPNCMAVPPNPSPQSVTAQRLLDDFEGDFDVVGHSYGGQIALEVALHAPERVRSLTVLCSRDTAFPPFLSLAAKVEAGEIPTVDTGLARWFSPAELDADPPAVETARGYLRSAAAQDWARALKAIATYDAAARTPALSMPVTFIAANHDGVSDPVTMRAMADRVLGATFEVHDGWFHMSAFVDPKSLARRLRAARAKSDGSARP